MVMSKFRLIFISITVLLLVIAPFSGCVDGKNNKPFWDVTNGYFHTNDVKLAQAEVPYTIILPKYLPSDIVQNPNQIYGPVKSGIDTKFEIKIEYKKSDFLIYITEINEVQNWGPNSDLSPIYFESEGVQVIRENANAFSSSGTVKGWNYYWNQSGLTFRVGAFSFTEDEAIKVVESMIKQAE